MTDLEILVNEKIKSYKQKDYFDDEAKERIINSLEKFLEENKNTFDEDLNEIERLNEDIKYYLIEKRKLENKYNRFIDLSELQRMKFKRENKTLYRLDEVVSLINNTFIYNNLTDNDVRKLFHLLQELSLLRDEFKEDITKENEINKKLDVIEQMINVLRKEEKVWVLNSMQ